MELNGFIRIVDFRLSLYTRIGVTITAEQLFNAVFHFGHFRAAIQLARLELSQTLDLSRVTRQVSTDFNT
ncbi:hypothetical protein D3C72_1740070 [compost metagenome]